MFAAEFDSEGHRQLREEMCNLEILGPGGACCYYVSVPTGIDHFKLWDAEFYTNVREFVATDAGHWVLRIPPDVQLIECCAPYMKWVYVNKGHTGVGRVTKQELGVVRLLQHPESSDEEVARRVRTTEKQLDRSSVYRQLRRLVGQWAG